MKPTNHLCGACRHFQSTKGKWLGDCIKNDTTRFSYDKACKYYNNQYKHQ